MVQLPVALLINEMVTPFMPLLAQMVGVSEVKVTALPDAPPVALTVKAGALTSTLATGLKVMVCVPCVMLIDCVTCSAALKLASPA